MLAKFLRRWIGSVRMAVFLISLASGLAVVAAEVIFKRHPSPAAYNTIIALAGLAAVFVWKDTERPSGYSPAGGFRYHDDQEGTP